MVALPPIGTGIPTCKEWAQPGISVTYYFDIKLIGINMGIFYSGNLRAGLHYGGEVHRS
jgi:hypothetical protein